MQPKRVETLSLTMWSGKKGEGCSCRTCMWDWITVLFSALGLNFHRNEQSNTSTMAVSGARMEAFDAAKHPLCCLQMLRRTPGKKVMKHQSWSCFLLPRHSCFLPRQLQCRCHSCPWSLHSKWSTMCGGTSLSLSVCGPIPLLCQMVLLVPSIAHVCWKFFVFVALPANIPHCLGPHKFDWLQITVSRWCPKNLVPSLFCGLHCLPWFIVNDVLLCLLLQVCNSVIFFVLNMLFHQKRTEFHFAHLHNLWDRVIMHAMVLGFVHDNEGWVIWLVHQLILEPFREVPSIGHLVTISFVVSFVSGAKVPPWMWNDASTVAWQSFGINWRSLDGAHNAVLLSLVLVFLPHSCMSAGSHKFSDGFHLAVMMNATFIKAHFMEPFSLGKRTILDHCLWKFVSLFNFHRA